jgi:hypothetical protein
MHLDDARKKWRLPVGQDFRRFGSVTTDELYEWRVRLWRSRRRSGDHRTAAEEGKE